MAMESRQSVQLSAILQLQRRILHRWPDRPPQECLVGDEAGGLQLLDEAVELAAVGKTGRQARARASRRWLPSGSSAGPVAAPRQNGEDVDSARNTGRKPCARFITEMRWSGSGTATWMCRPHRWTRVDSAPERSRRGRSGPSASASAGASPRTDACRRRAAPGHGVRRSRRGGAQCAQLLAGRRRARRACGHDLDHRGDDLAFDLLAERGLCFRWNAGGISCTQLRLSASTRNSSSSRPTV